MKKIPQVVWLVLAAVLGYVFWKNKGTAPSGTNNLRGVGTSTNTATVPALTFAHQTANPSGVTPASSGAGGGGGLAASITGAALKKLFGSAATWLTGKDKSPNQDVQGTGGYVPSGIDSTDGSANSGTGGYVPSGDQNFDFFNGANQADLNKAYDDSLPTPTAPSADPFNGYFDDGSTPGDFSFNP